MLERTRRRDAARLAGIVAVGSLAACGVALERITPEQAGQEARERMLRGQIEARGVQDPRVLHAMRSVPRERFVPEAQRSQAYEDRPLPIGHGQTISQPFVVAAMTEALRAQPTSVATPPPEEDTKEDTSVDYDAALAQLREEIETLRQALLRAPQTGSPIVV